MTIDVTTLIETKTSEQALADVLDLMDTAGFNITSFHAGGLGLGFATLLAECWARIYNACVIPSLKLAFNETAEDTGLDWYSQANYDNFRIRGVATRQQVTVTDIDNAGPLNIAASSFVVADANDTTVTFRSIEALAVPLGGSDTIEVECEQVGVIGNVPNGRLTSPVTSIAGFSVTNGTVGGASVITRQGTDRERNSVLRQRNTTKWASLSPNTPINAYKNLVLNATDTAGDPVGITKVSVDGGNPGGPGTVYIYIANDSATATSLQVTDVQAYMDDDRRSPNAQPTVYAATEVEVDITGYMTARRGYGAAAKAAFITAVTDYIDGLDCGGEQLDGQPGGDGYVLLSTIIELAKSQSGVLDYISATPNSNIEVLKSRVATVGTITVYLTEV